MEHLLSSVRLLGNVSSQFNRQRRSLIQQCLNPGLADMPEEDQLFCDPGIRLFGEGFSKKAKERDDELKAFSKVDQRRAPSSGSSASWSSSFPRASTCTEEASTLQCQHQGKTEVRCLPAVGVIPERQARK